MIFFLKNRYSKIENHNIEDYLQYTHLLTSNATQFEPKFNSKAVVDGFDKFSLSKKFPFIHFHFSPKIYLMERVKPIENRDTK